MSTSTNPTTDTIGILGGSGFVGAVIANHLLKRGYRVRILTRARQHARELWLLPNTEIVETDALDQDHLGHAVAGCAALINLVGILNERGDSGAGFRRAHVDIAVNAAKVCKTHDVPRLLHMSALHADSSAPSHYLRSKGEAEKLVMAEQSKRLAITILRPSVIFGPHDSFLNRFAQLLALTPGVFPLACANARFQPVYVGDVADAFLAVLDDPATGGHKYDLGGPEIFTLAEIVAYVARLIDRPTRIIPLGRALSALQANIFEYLPGKPFSRDNLRSAGVDSVCPQANGLLTLGITPTAMEVIVPQYLGRRRLRARYDIFRGEAGR